MFSDLIIRIIPIDIKFNKEKYDTQNLIEIPANKKITRFFRNKWNINGALNFKRRMNVCRAVRVSHLANYFFYTWMS